MIGDEIDDEPTWEEKAVEFEEKVKAGGKEALPVIAKVGLAGLALGVVCAVGVGAVPAKVIAIIEPLPSHV